MGLFSLFKREKYTEDGLKVPRKGEPEYVPFQVVETDKGEYRDWLDLILKHSVIMLITGKRGSGKSALGMKFLELYNKKTRKRCHAIGFENTKLPKWIKKESDIEKTPNNSVVLVDEGGVTFSARDAMKASNKFLSKMMAVARHRGLSLLLISQNSSLIELNVLRLGDVVLLKEPSLLQAKFERKAIREMYEQIKPKFTALKERKKYFYVWADEFQGLVESGLPEFWSEKISKSFG